MNILVIGCDQVGASLIRDLERIGHDISVVEKDPEQLKRLDAFDDYTFHGTALVGDPTDPDTLRRGGVENCDAVAAVTEEDSVNLMAAQLAKNIFRRDKVICRVSDPHLQTFISLPHSTVCKAKTGCFTWKVPGTPPARSARWGRWSPARRPCGIKFADAGRIPGR